MEKVNHGTGSKKLSTATIAAGRWPHILLALGLNPRFLTNRHGPCPMCGGKDRYRFDDLEGRGSWICSACGAGDGFALLRKMFGWTFGQAARQVDSVVGNIKPSVIHQQRTDEQKMASIHRMWEESVPVRRDDPVWRYLRRRTGIAVVPADIRFHPSLPHADGGKHPVMLSLVRYPDGTVASLHRTFLSNDGQKASVTEAKKFMPGRPLKKAAVRTGPAAHRLGIGEGIESALAAQQRFGCTVWAATSASMLENWEPPRGAKKILIAGDNDAGFAGQAAAYALAKRLVAEGFAVDLHIPAATGTDWADEFAAKISLGWRRC